MKRGGPLSRRTPIRKVKLRAITDRQLDAACKAVVFALHGPRCKRCGGTSHLQWAHIYSRRYRSIRWTEGNSLPLCAGCHLWAHHQPLAFAQWWLQAFGEQADVMLRHAMKSPGKLDRALTLHYLQRRLKELARV